VSAEPVELAELRRRAGELADLGGIGGLLLWDQNTMMPPGGASARADQFAALERIQHDRLADPALANLLDRLEPWAASADPDSDDVRLLRNVARDHQKAVQVPTELAAEISSSAAHAQQAWMDAREHGDFNRFAPALERVLELQHRYVACFDGSGQFAHPYDVLLDDYEPGLTTEELRGLFSRLQAELVPLVSAAAAAGEDGHIFPGSYPIDAQRQVAGELLATVGFDPERWRLDASVHPFARSMAPCDVRLTTRWEEDDLAMAFYSCLHEFGHGLYEAQFEPSHYRTTLAEAAGLGVHESQSRLWENMVGRSRPYCAWLLPRLTRTMPGALDGLDAGALYRAVNTVQPSLVRTEADETTYNLHIILRFELELALIEGSLAVDDAPAAWDEAMERLLGIQVPSPVDGILQDVHWSSGLMGYFPTYTLGNLIGAQLWERLREELGDVDGQLERGEFAPLREWLRESVHQHGRKFLPRELLRRVTGDDLRVEPFLRYLREKLADAGVLMTAA
jgi:carboxypeptidase Taq